MSERAVGQRETGYDLMRVVSIFAMVIIHVCSSKWYATPITSYEWWVMNVFDSLSRFCVPVMIMISGRFFLDPSRNVTSTKIFKKYIPRLLVSFFFWSIIYALFNNRHVIYTKGMNYDMWMTLMLQTFKGNFHMWFIVTMIWLYAFTPLLRKVAESDKLTLYFVVLFILLSLVLANLRYFPIFADNVMAMHKNSNAYLTTSYAGYFMLGWYMHKHRPGAKLRYASYALAVVSVAITAVGTYLLSRGLEKPDSTMYGNMLPTTFIASFAVFAFFTNMREIKRGVRLLGSLSQCCYGIYLVHAIFLSLIYKKVMTVTDYNPVLTIPVMALMAFVCSYVLAFLLRKLPVVGKYIT